MAIPPPRDHRQSSHNQGGGLTLEKGLGRDAQSRSKYLLDEQEEERFPERLAHPLVQDRMRDRRESSPVPSSPTFPDSPGSMARLWRPCRPPPSRPVPTPPLPTRVLSSRSRGAKRSETRGSKPITPTARGSSAAASSGGGELDLRRSTSSAFYSCRFTGAERLTGNVVQPGES